MKDTVKMLPRYRAEEANKQYKKKSCKKTTKQYKEELAIKNPNVELIGEYVNSKTKVPHRYKKCGHINNVSPSSALQGFGCNKCTRAHVGERFKSSQEKYEENVYKNNPNIKILGKYISATDKIRALCLLDGYEWEPIAGALSRTNFSGCPECAKRKYGDALRKSLNQYINDVSIVNPYIEVIGTEYKNGNTPLLHKCLQCNYEWSPFPCNILAGSGCPNCNMSRGERETMKVLDKYCIPYKSQKTFNDLVGVGGGLLSYDFYLPSYNLLIEFQGEQHKNVHSGLFGGEEQFKKQKEHDKRKREYAKQNNIELLEIWYYDIDNIESILLQKFDKLQKII